MSTLYDKLPTSTRPTSSDVSPVVKQFLDAVDYGTKTRLDDPGGWTFADLTTLWCASEKVQRVMLGIKGNRPVTDADLLAYMDMQGRINLISRNGEERKEAAEVAIGVVAQQQKKDLGQKLLEGVAIR